MNSSIAAAITLAATLALAGQPTTPTPATPATPTAPPADTATPVQPPKVEGDGYYLSDCAQCAKALGRLGDTILKPYDGRQGGFCCDNCRVEFEKDLPSSLAKLDAVMVKDQLAHYPLEISVVSGKPLGKSAVDWIWCNRLVRLAAPGEKAEFLKDPRTFIRRLDKAVIEEQTPTYGMTKCPVQGDILENDDIIDIVVANRMVRVCCQKCAVRVRNHPRQFLALVDFANKEKAEKARTPG